MTIRFHNNNQMNLMNMLQQGIGMFCENNMFQQGINMFGRNNMLGMNGSLFNFNGGLNIGSTNMCSIMGYAVNYDAMAGMAVANSVMGVLSQAASSSQAEKQNDRAIYYNNKNQIENIDSQIEDLKAEYANPKVDDKYNTDISSAQTALASANTDLENAKNKKTELVDKKNTATTDEEKTNIQKQIDEIEKEITEKDTKVKECEKKLDDANTAKAKAKTDKQAEIQAKIDALEAQKAKLQKEVDSVELDDADGSKLQRLSDKKYNASLNPEGTVRDDVKYTKKHARTAVNHFMKAVKEGSKEAQVKTAKTLVAIYGRLDSSDKTVLLKNAVETAKRYIKEDTETK